MKSIKNLVPLLNRILVQRMKPKAPKDGAEKAAVVAELFREDAHQLS